MSTTPKNPFGGAAFAGGAPPGISMGAQFSLDDVIKIHRERKRTREFEELGRIVWIGLEIQTKPGETLSSVERILRSKIDYMSVGPMLALSLDKRDLLLPQDVVPFPDIPDPTWAPPMARQEEIEAKDWKPTTPPLVHQSLTERATAKYENADGVWVIFQPVTEIWFRPLRAPIYAAVRCVPFNDTRTALMINVATAEAFFYGGRFEVGR